MPGENAPPTGPRGGSGITLLLDASGLRVETARIHADGSTGAAFSDTGMALECLFGRVQELLAGEGSSLGTLDRLVFCRGPGSILGLRAVLMALRVWRTIGAIPGVRLQSYRSLDLAAAWLLERGQRPPFAVVVPYRRTRWQVLEVGPEGPDPEAPIESVDAGALGMASGGSLFFLQQRMLQLEGLPGPVIKPRWSTLGGWLKPDSPLLREETDAPLVIEMPEEPRFALWHGRRHGIPHPDTPSGPATPFRFPESGTT